LTVEIDKTLLAGASAAYSLPDLRPGRRFAERYDVEELLGRGGMGAVYRVHDSVLGETVALKLLTLSAPDAVEGFLREVRLARRVTHRNVARTHDFGEHDGLRFLTMEYVRGAALSRKLLADGRMPPERAAGIAAQIAAGLGAAHAAGIVHRDLKPANVMIEEGGRVVLTDFGIACAAHAEATSHASGSLAGTPLYMSPEQVTGGELDARSDLYALGLILFELCTGQIPFRGENPIATAVARLSVPAPDPRAHAPIPEALAELIVRCLQRAPEDRPASADTLRDELAAHAGGFRDVSSSAHVPLGAPTASNPSGLFAPLCPSQSALAILPFVYRGAADQSYLSDALAEELIDLLSRTQGLRVLSLGATRRFSDERDPQRIGRELGASTLVDGTVQPAGDRVRIAARLIDTGSGVQRWSERFEGRFEDVFALQESMGRRVAESLRLELDAAVHRRTAPQEAIELYLKARRLLRADVMARASEAVEMLDRCLELAPDFKPALSAHATACLRAIWQVSVGVPMTVPDVAASVARALEQAPDLAETHLVLGMDAVQRGAYQEAARALARALEIAPTLAEAHQYLGQLQVEAGQLREGRRRLELALELDPTLHSCRLTFARIAAFHGDFDEAARQLAGLSELGDPAPVTTLIAGRYALWKGDKEEALRVLERVGDSNRNNILLMLQAALGQRSVESALALYRSDSTARENVRFAALLGQLATEAFAAAGEHEIALATLSDLADGALIDVPWMQQCPMLAPLRDTEAFASSLERVKARAADIWRR
jgi:eukaryotic-like serine/threonine-protein kinase